GRAAEDPLRRVGADPDVERRAPRGPPAFRLGGDRIGARLRRRAEGRDQLEVAGPPALRTQPARALRQAGELVRTELPRHPALAEPGSASQRRGRAGPDPDPPPPGPRQ